MGWQTGCTEGGYRAPLSRVSFRNCTINKKYINFEYIFYVKIFSYNCVI
jgi:hypothetical protein